MKGANLPFILLAKRHDNPASGKIDDLNANEHHVANHGRMNEEKDRRRAPDSKRRQAETRGAAFSDQVVNLRNIARDHQACAQNT